MARIKYVLNERRLAYEGALKLAEKQIYEDIERNANKQPFDAEDREVLRFQLGRAFKERVQKASAEPASTSTDSSPAASTEQDETPKRGRRRGKPKPSKRSREAMAQAS